MAQALQGKGLQLDAVFHPGSINQQLVSPAVHCGQHWHTVPDIIAVRSQLEQP